MNCQCVVVHTQKAKPLSTIIPNLVTFFLRRRRISRHLLNLHDCRPIFFNCSFGCRLPNYIINLNLFFFFLFASDPSLCRHQLRQNGHEVSDKKNPGTLNNAKKRLKLNSSSSTKIKIWYIHFCIILMNELFKKTSICWFNLNYVLHLIISLMQL